MKKLIFLLVIPFIFFGCRKPTKPSNNTLVLENNLGQFQFNNYEPLVDMPVNIHYYIPDLVDRQNAPILFVFPGMNRNANTYRDTWINLADTKGIMIFSFEFPTAFYPNSVAYQEGNIVNQNGVLNTEDKWSFSIVEPVFDYIKTSFNYNHNFYDLFGHSAGAQFVHRYILFKPYSRVRKAISANSGWYTIPDTSVLFPYGLKNIPENNFDLSNSFNKQLEIHLGLLDNNANDPSLRKTPEANAQGFHRLSRGRYFVSKSDSIAQSMNYSINWVKKEVPDVAHNHGGMSAFAAEELY